MSSNGEPIQEISDTVGQQVNPRNRDRLPARDRPRHPWRATVTDDVFGDDNPDESN
jgi:hypothetical protein